MSIGIQYGEIKRTYCKLGEQRKGREREDRVEGISSPSKIDKRKIVEARGLTFIILGLDSLGYVSGVERQQWFRTFDDSLSPLVLPYPHFLHDRRSKADESSQELHLFKPTRLAITASNDSTLSFLISLETQLLHTLSCESSIS